MTDAPWDKDLVNAILHAGVAVPEERVIDVLLADMAESLDDSDAHPQNL